VIVEEALVEEAKEVEVVAANNKAVAPEAKMVIQMLLFLVKIILTVW